MGTVQHHAERARRLDGLAPEIRQSIIDRWIGLRVTDVAMGEADRLERGDTVGA
ncbi:hypothetical protein NO357_15050 [Marimonas arenosa]|uniref:Uncharacterized protein n=1 Tax=Marimonas arenosa TaxID=1795305 RepID=A0AAE4B5D7_9RHOB|nr:hypothetical protein [Marimonas arenosa]MDQ2091220.1 hypothetical protein [Marimonas arenosa]